MRIALGCMRLSTEAGFPPETAAATIEAALDAGFPLFDTARSYAPSGHELGHNERLLARILKTHARGANVRVVTKCGMRRDSGAWIPDGRAKSLADDAKASVEALDGIPIDLLLLHAPDPRIPLTTSARALARIVDSGIARQVGVSNVSRKQLEEVAAQVPVAGVEIALGAFDDLPLRNGVVSWCIEQRIPILAHAPLGGPERAQRLARDPRLASIAKKYEVSGADVFLSYLLAVHPEIIPVVGARKPETIARLAAVARLQLEEQELLQLDAHFPSFGTLRRPAPVSAPRNAEVVMMMGIAGAGKSSAAQEHVTRGYERLNRDTIGGTLRAIAERLDERLSAGRNHFVLDNTYVTRASRSDVLRIAARHGAAVRCLFFNTSLQDAQINAVLRMIDRFDHVLTPEEIAARARSDPTALAPHALSRMARDLEPPALEEGFVDITSVPFVRRYPENTRPGLFVPMGALESVNTLADLKRLIDRGPEGAPCLVFGWQPEGSDEVFRAAIQNAAHSIAESTGRIIEVAHCPHPGGPPICWCRPPLPGLFLSFVRRHNIDLPASLLYASGPTDRTIARVLGLPCWW